MVEEVQQVQEKSNSKLVWIIVPIVVVVLGILIFIFMSGSSDVPTQESSGTQNSGSSDGPINILDKSFKIDETGKPTAIFILADVTAGSCRLAYNGNLIEKNSVVPENGQSSLSAPLNNRLDLNLWSICCDKSSELISKGGDTFCKNE